MVKYFACSLLLCCSFWAFAQRPSLAYDYGHQSIVDQYMLQKNDTEASRIYLLYKRYKENIRYKNAPYKGLYFDLGKRFEEHRLFDELTFGLGAFTWDFKESAYRKVSGHLFGRPLYLGWDLKLKNQLYISTGTTLLETHQNYNNTRKTMLFNSFWGLSGKIKLNR